LVGQVFSANFLLSSLFWTRDDLAVAQEQMDLVRKARRYEVEVEKEREAARLRHLAELERQRADKRER
jgi:hypothetical protein